MKQRSRPNLLSHAWLRFDFFSTNQWARFRPHYNSHHKWWTAQYSAGMLTNPADTNCQCQDYTNIFHPICREHFVVLSYTPVPSTNRWQRASIWPPAPESGCIFSPLSIYLFLLSHSWSIPTSYTESFSALTWNTMGMGSLAMLPTPVLVLPVGDWTFSNQDSTLCSPYLIQLVNMTDH